MESKFKAFLRFYHRIRSYLLAVLVVITCVIGIIPGLSGNPVLFAGFLCASCLLFLEMFLGIYTVIMKEMKPAALQFKGIDQMMPALFNELEKRSHRREKTLCQILANSGNQCINLLQRKLIQQVGKLNVEFELYLMDLEFAEKFLKDTPARINRRKATIKAFEEFLKMQKNELESIGVNLKCYSYSLTPMLHGALVDEEWLYLSHFIWGRAFSGAEHNYKLCKLNNGFDTEHILCFKDWLRHAKNTANKVYPVQKSKK